MNGYPPIPPLEPTHVKELVRQIRAMRVDFPHGSVEELAAEWRDVQLWRIGEHRPTPFAAWIETPDWEAGFARAVAFAERLRERAAKQRELRQKAKAWKKERKQR